MLSLMLILFSLNTANADHTIDELKKTMSAVLEANENRRGNRSDSESPSFDYKRHRQTPPWHYAYESHDPHFAALSNSSDPELARLLLYMRQLAFEDWRDSTPYSYAINTRRPLYLFFRFLDIPVAPYVSELGENTASEPWAERYLKDKKPKEAYAEQLKWIRDSFSSNGYVLDNISLSAYTWSFAAFITNQWGDEQNHLTQLMEAAQLSKKDRTATLRWAKNTLQALTDIIEERLATEKPVKMGELLTTAKKTRAIREAIEQRTQQIKDQKQGAYRDAFNLIPLIEESSDGVAAAKTRLTRMLRYVNDFGISMPYREHSILNEFDYHHYYRTPKIIAALNEMLTDHISGKKKQPPQTLENIIGLLVRQLILELSRDEATFYLAHPDLLTECLALFSPHKNAAEVDAERTFTGDLFFGEPELAVIRKSIFSYTSDNQTDDGAKPEQNYLIDFLNRARDQQVLERLAHFTQRIVENMASINTRPVIPRRPSVPCQLELAPFPVLPRISDRVR